MTALLEVLAIVAILANAIIYGTDVFGAIVQRPALASVDDRSLTQVMGQIHRVADRRLQRTSIVGLLATIAVIAVAASTGNRLSAGSGALALAALITFVVIYTRISKPVNTALTEAAVADRVPSDARQLQSRWDSVINGRVALETVALVALCVALLGA